MGELYEGIPADELIRLIDCVIDEAEARLFDFDEELAIRLSGHDDGKSAARHAATALQRSEAFPGEHDCARQYLRDIKSHIGIFTKGKN